MEHAPQSLGASWRLVKFGIDYGAVEALVKSDGVALGVKEGMVDGTTLGSDNGLVLRIAFDIYDGSDKVTTPGPANL